MLAAFLTTSLFERPAPRSAQRRTWRAAFATICWNANVISSCVRLTSLAGRFKPVLTRLGISRKNLWEKMRKLEHRQRRHQRAPDVDLSADNDRLPELIAGACQLALKSKPFHPITDHNMTTTQFDNVSVATQASVYFDGKCISHQHHALPMAPKSQSAWCCLPASRSTPVRRRSWNVWPVAASTNSRDRTPG
jgi:hypothetical protein